MWRPPGSKRVALPVANWPTAAVAGGSRWFAPAQLGPVRLEERTWIPAMVPWRATEAGEVTDAVLDWYGRFAEGQPGAIVVEATGIRDVNSGPLLRIGTDRYLDGLKRLVERVRTASAGRTRLLIQLIDFLAIRRRPPAEKYLQRFLELREPHRAAATAVGADPDDDQAVRAALLALPDEQLPRYLNDRELEALRFGYRERVTDTHLPHIADLPERLPELFASAAARAAQAGFDGVELHYAHAYTMASMLSGTNHRNDGYGGSVEGRLRLPLEVLAASRAAVPRHVAVGCRFLADECIDGGYGVEDAERYAVAFARAGIHFLSLSRGGKFDDAKQPKIGWAAYPYTGRSGYECMPTVYSDERGPFGRNVAAAAAIRRAVRGDGHDVPIIVSGGITTFEQAEAILEHGHADIVGAARQSLADPDWFQKIREGRGDQIRRCEFTNYCEGLDQMHKQVTCKLWDRKDLANAKLLSHDGRRRLTAPRDP